MSVVSPEHYQRLAVLVHDVDAALRVLHLQEAIDTTNIRNKSATLSALYQQFTQSLQKAFDQSTFLKELIGHDSGNNYVGCHQVIGSLMKAVSFSIEEVLNEELREMPPTDPRKEAGFMESFAQSVLQYCAGDDEPSAGLMTMCQRLDYHPDYLPSFRVQVRNPTDTPFEQLFLREFGGDCTGLDVPALRSRVISYCRADTPNPTEETELAHALLLPAQLTDRVLPGWRMQVQKQAEKIDMLRSDLWVRMWNVLRAIESAGYWVPNNTLEPKRLAVKRFLGEATPSLLLRCGKSTNQCLTIQNELPEETEALFHEGTVGNLLINIVGNARSRGRAEHISISTGEDANSVTITVEDDGIGFDEATEERLFELGFTTSGVGKGLGLAEANKRMAAFGGSIRAEGHGGLQNKSGGKGAKFTLTVPKRERR